MTNSAERSIRKTLGIEGGYSNHPADTGGKTNFGITEEVARKHGYEGEMKDLPLELAKQIYFEDYWNENNLQEVAKLNEAVAYEIFDTAVNCGSETAVKFFQRSLNAFNLGGSLFDDIKVDGKLGKNTLKAWAEYHGSRSRGGINASEIMTKALNGLQTSYYIRLSEKDDSYETFIFGWINQRVN